MTDTRVSDLELHAAVEHDCLTGDSSHHRAARLIARHLVNARSSIELAMVTVEAALSELGVPDEHYPAPVANAVTLLRAALDDLREGMI
jgi:hypothetical protein